MFFLKNVRENLCYLATHQGNVCRKAHINPVTVPQAEPLKDFRDPDTKEKYNAPCKRSEQKVSGSGNKLRKSNAGLTF